MAAQRPSGGWSNILTNSSTFEETSASAMFLAGLARGRRKGWLEDTEGELEAAIGRAWAMVGAGRGGCEGQLGAGQGLHWCWIW
jgi:rhamnogalacturonyl hydrolase YesR